MPDYSKGKIYKIVSNQTKKIYIGSTVQHYLCDRLTSHKYGYKKWKKTNKNNFSCSSYLIIKYNDAKIILIEEYPCETKDQLKAREQFFIDTTKNCCNKYRANTTPEDRQKYLKEYRRINREQLNKENRDNNKIKKHCIYCDIKYCPTYHSKHQKTIQHRQNEQWANDYLNSLL
jgi:hypothetical protein